MAGLAATSTLTGSLVQTRASGGSSRAGAVMDEALLAGATGVASSWSDPISSRFQRRPQRRNERREGTGLKALRFPRARSTPRKTLRATSPPEKSPLRFQARATIGPMCTPRRSLSRTFGAPRPAVFHIGLGDTDEYGRNVAHAVRSRSHRRRRRCRCSNRSTRPRRPTFSASVGRFTSLRVNGRPTDDFDATVHTWIKFGVRGAYDL